MVLSISTWLARVGGARQDVLVNLPGAVGRQASMGAVILTTAAFAGVSAGFALSMTKLVTGYGTVAAGILWAIAILNLDRLMVLGLSKERGLKRNLALAAPRIVLALIIGFVISTPLVLKIFEPEINAQIAETNVSTIIENNSTLSGSSIQADLNDTNSKIAQLQAVVAAGPTADPVGNPAVSDIDSQIASLQAQYDQQNADFQAKQDAYISERDGTGGTRRVGCASECAEKLRIANDARAIRDATKARIDALGGERTRKIQELTPSLLSESQQQIDNANADLPALIDKSRLLTTQLQSSRSTVNDATAQNTGLIARLNALSVVSAESFAARFWRTMIGLLFVAMELLPVIFKVISNLGNVGLYDKVLTSVENHEARLATKEIRAERKRHQLRLDAELVGERDRLSKQAAVIEHINDTVVKHQQLVVDDALKLWLANAQQHAQQNMPSWVKGSPGGPANLPGPPVGATTKQSAKSPQFGPSHLPNP